MIFSIAGMCLSDSESMSVSCVAHSLVFHCGLEKTVSRQPLIKTNHLAYICQCSGRESPTTFLFDLSQNIFKKCLLTFIFLDILSNQICLRGVQPDTHTYTKSRTNTQYVLLVFWPLKISNLYLICGFMIGYTHCSLSRWITAWPWWHFGPMWDI